MNSNNNLLSYQKRILRPVSIITVIAGLLVLLMPFLGEVGMANPKTAGVLGLSISFLGQFHPLFLHLPIGALFIIFALEALNLLTKGKVSLNTTLPLALASITGVAAVALGYFLYLTGAYEGDLIESHKRDGIIFTLFLLTTFLVKYLYDLNSKKTFQFGYWAGLAFTGIYMMLAGHHGGKITHGDPLDSNPLIILKERNAARNATITGESSVLNEIITPILKDKCFSCHGEEKQKSGLRLDTYAFMLKGGEETDSVLTPGDLEKSSLVTTLHLPKEDDLHMPPEGKTQLTPEEIKLIEWWVVTGASETATVAQLKKETEKLNTPNSDKTKDAPNSNKIKVSFAVPAIDSALKSLVPEKVKIEREKAKAENKKKELKQRQEKRAKQKTTFESIEKKFPRALNYLSQQDLLFSFSAGSFRKSFTEENLKNLSPIGNDLYELNLSNTTITDKALDYIKSYKNLAILNLSNTAITPAVASSLVELKNLEILNLYGTSIDDSVLKELQKLPKLRKVFVWATAVTAAGIAELEAHLKQQDKRPAPPKGMKREYVISGIKTK